MKKNFDIVDKGANRYVVGEVKPFDQKNDVFKVAGLHLGAAKACVCVLDRRWIYSDGYTRTKGGSGACVNIG